MPKKDFPKIVTINGTKYVFRLMDAKDRHSILNFARGLSESDLSFMRRDITQAEVVDAWIKDIECNRAISIIVEDEDRLVGYGTLYYNQLFWNRHLAEIRVLVSSPYRNRGLGKRLTRELMALAREMPLDKVMVYLAIEDKGAQHMVEEIGFKAEALLTDWIKTRDERTHDLLIMATSLADG
ncbi:MAG: GNAT family N-acetyltransferase [Chloroflexi bacterium]|nr:GNAT family N-acetyltransferase [Chloroflexota bacterium]